eukprot:gene18315-37184_t
MRLVSVQVQNYRCIIDSGTVDIDENVTCLVGKNESGKTAFLRSLHMLNPLNPIKGKTKFDPVMDYPAKDYGKFKRLTEDEAKRVVVVSAQFELSNAEVTALEAAFGANCVKNRVVTVEAGYGGNKTYSPVVDEAVAGKHLVSKLELRDEDKSKAAAISSVTALSAVLAEVAEPHSTVTQLIATITKWREQRLSLAVIDTYLSKWLPKFFYFDDYSVMPGRVGLEKLRSKISAGDDLTEGEEAFLAFLEMGGTDLDSMATGTRTEALFRELENAGIAITTEAMEFWTQNEGLQVKVRESQADPNDEDPSL